MSFVLDKPVVVEHALFRSNHLKILMVSARYWPFVGGTETHVHEVGKRMVLMGYDVTVLTTDLTGKLPVTEVHDAVRVVRLKAYPRNRDYYFAPNLYSFITSNNWDIIHLQGYHTLIAPLTMLAAIASKTPFIVSFHSGGHSSALRTSVRWIQRALLSPLLKRASRLICVSQFEAKFFQEKLGLSLDNFTVIPNGSQLPKTSSQSPTGRETLIVSLGRLERYKGHQYAIAALPYVLQQRPDVKLRIVGTGPYEDELHKLVTKMRLDHHVEIAGIPASDREGMARILHQASLVVLFSDYEAHPVAIMEALSLGASVLVTDTSGLGEIARKGWVNAIPVGSEATHIATAILNQLEHPLTPDGITLPTWDECADSLVKVYESVTTSARAV